MLLFDFVVRGAPVSSQAHRGTPRQRYRDKVSAAADALWDSEHPQIATPVAVTMTHFFEGAPADIDNIPKLILDGMKGHVLTDDALVSDLILQRRPIAGPYVITAPTPRLTEALGTGREFVHIAVASPPTNAELRPYDYP